MRLIPKNSRKIPAKAISANTIEVGDSCGIRTS
jgi:hypothetical protein